VITLVLDASVAIELFARDRRPHPELRRRVLTGAAAAPELMDLEICNVVRTMVLRGEARREEAAELVRDIRDAPVLRVGHRHLVDRVWELRDDVTAYDASYLALAEAVGVPLLTCDARVSRAGGHHAEVELYPRS
jgi:predicted nucleic acid-binding protein